VVSRDIDPETGRLTARVISLQHVFSL